MKLLKKKVNVFGKSIPVLAIFVLGIALVSAALVPYFASITGSATATAPITLEQSLFTFGDSATLNDGENHYLLLKGNNAFAEEIPADVVINITKDGLPITDMTGIHLALDAGGDMHYCYDSLGDMTGISDCDTQYVQWLENGNNEDWFDWVGIETYEESGFESSIVNHGGDSWMDVSAYLKDGVLTLPGVNPDSGLLAALLVIRADIALEPGEYTVQVDIVPAE